MCEYMCVKSLTKIRSAIKFNLHILYYFENKTKKYTGPLHHYTQLVNLRSPPPIFSADLWQRNSSESVILVSQVSSLLTLINPLGFRQWDSRASNQTALSKQHENNMTGVSQLYFKPSTASSCLINIILFNILGFSYTNIIFQQNRLLPWEKGNNSYKTLDSSDTLTKSAICKVKMRVSESEVWLAKMWVSII